MYDRRFHKWGVSKYVKRGKAAKLKPRHHQSPSSQDWPIDPPSTQDPSPFWNRNGCAVLWTARMRTPVAHSHPASDDSADSQSSASPREMTKCGLWLDAADDRRGSPPARIPCSRSCACDDCETNRSSDYATSNGDGRYLSSVSSSVTMNVLRPVSRDAKRFDMERVLSSLQAFCSSHFDTQPDVYYRSTLLTRPTTSAVRQTWMQLHDCIYLFKLNDTRRAIAGLEEIRKLPATSLIDHSPLVVLEVVASLAPINTKRYPYIRSYILTHVLKASQSELGPQHPITVICAQLSRDADSQDVSRTALSCLAHLVSNKDAAFRLRVRLAAVDMLRREKDFAAAAHLAEDVLETAELEFGTNSPQRRRAARKLTHVYLDSGDYTRALELCRSVVGRQTSASAFSFKDYDAVRGMEDLAEVHRLLGEYGSSSLWLSAAADLSSKLLGRSLTTVHIVDKLVDMAQRAGKNDEAAAYQRTFAAFL